MIITDAIEGELTYLKDIDLKSYDSMWSAMDWQIALDICFVRLGYLDSRPIGFMVCYHDQPTTRVYLSKLAVLPAYRRQGYGRQLFEDCLAYAQSMAADYIGVTIPEYKCSPGSRYDCSSFLQRMGFQAELPLIDDFTTYLGQTEKGVPFERSCKIN